MTQDTNDRLRRYLDICKSPARKFIVRTTNPDHPVYADQTVDHTGPIDRLDEKGGIHLPLAPSLSQLRRNVDVNLDIYVRIGFRRD